MSRSIASSPSRLLVGDTSSCWLTIEREQPEWVERVRREWEFYRDIESVAFWAEVPIQAVVTILENLYQREELGSDGT